jgi:CheY-like chemotaxis protein
MLSVVPIARPTVIRRPRPYVLLVDDHAPSLRRLCQVVKGAGHPCVAAGSASEALTHCETHRPQVVVTDLSMPNLDGLGLAGWMHLRYPSVPLILMTGQPLDSSSFDSLRRTFTEVLRKPLDVERFLSRIDRLMPRPLNLDPTLTAPPS